MTDQELFRRECVRLGQGRRLEIENHPDVPAAPVYAETRHFAEQLIASARAELPSLPPIHFDFIEDGTVNAVAFRAQGRYFIGITAGAISMLHLILNRILANPMTFASVGQPEAEDPNLPPVPWHDPNAENLYRAGVRPILPKDAARGFYALHLATQSLMFLVGHEIAHITRGHVDYLMSKRGANFVAELGWTGPLQGRLERQALEADADERSVRARCHSALGTANQAGQTFPPWSDSPLPDVAWQFDWSFAVNSLFRLFGDSRFSGKDLSSESYPPLPMRQFMAMDAGVGFLVQAWGEKRKDDAIRTLFGAVRETEGAFRAVGAAPSDGGFLEANSAEGRAHMTRIRDKMLAVREDLKQFSHEPFL